VEDEKDAQTYLVFFLRDFEDRPGTSLPVEEMVSPQASNTTNRERLWIESQKIVEKWMNASNQPTST